MMDKQELNLNELENVAAGLEEGQLCTVHGTKHYLALRGDYCYDDDNIIRKKHNGDELIFYKKVPNGYALVEDPKDGRLGYVNAEYIR